MRAGVETTFLRRRLTFAGAVTREGDTRLPKRVFFGKWGMWKRGGEADGRRAGHTALSRIVNNLGWSPPPAVTQTS